MRLKYLFPAIKLGFTSKEFRNMVSAERAFNKQRRTVRRAVNRIAIQCIDLSLTNYPEHAKAIHQLLGDIDRHERNKVKKIQDDIKAERVRIFKEFGIESE